MKNSTLCPNCNRPIDKYLILSSNKSCCGHCSAIVTLPLQINIPLIVLTKWGVCPSCLSQNFEFKQRDNLYLCYKCGAVFEFLVPPKILLQTFTELIHGSPHEQEANESKWDKMLSKVERQLLLILRSIKSKGDLLLALKVEFNRFYGVYVSNVLHNHQESESRITTKLDDIEKLASIIREMKEPSEFDSGSLQETVQQLQILSIEFEQKANERLCAICHSLILSIKNVKDFSKPENLVVALHIECPKCRFPSMIRFYRIIKYGSEVLNTIDELNSAECPNCEFKGRIPFSFAIYNLDSKKISGYLDYHDHENSKHEKRITWIFEFMEEKYPEIQFEIDYVTSNLDEFLKAISKQKENKIEKIRVGNHAFLSGIGTLKFLGAKYYSLAKYDKALKVYQSSLLYDPHDTESYEGAAASYAGLKKYEAAFELLAKAETITDEDAGKSQVIIKPDGLVELISGLSIQDAASLNVISDHAKEELYETIVEYLSGYLLDYPNDQEMCFFLCTAYQELGRIESMLKSALKTIAIQPNNSQIAHGARMLLSLAVDDEQITHYLKDMY